MNDKAMTARALLEADSLAQEIRRVDGDHSLGAGALAEALMPFLNSRIASSLEGQADAVEDGEGFFHLDNLAAVCQREGFSDRDYERLSYALEVTRTDSTKDKPA